MIKLEVKNINKTFNGLKVLNDINFLVGDGEVVSLLGESGCGKSTTLKIIAGLIEPDSGDVILNEDSILNVPPDKRKTVIVFQEHLLFPHLNVENNIAFGLKMAGVKKKIKENKVAEIISLLKLQGLEKRYPKELSGGQRQRVALGRALAIEPKVLLLDEPFSSLDIRLRDEMRELVLDIQKKLKITTILVTHDKEEALMMSDKIAVMIKGVIAQFDTPESIYERPINPLVADFFGEKNYIEGYSNKGMFECSFGKFPVEDYFQGNSKIMIKPEDIELSQEDEDCGSKQELHLGNEDKYESKDFIYNEENSKEKSKIEIKGTIKKRRYLGDKVHYIVEVDGKELKVISNEYMKFSIGDKVMLRINISKGIFYPAIEE